MDKTSTKLEFLHIVAIDFHRSENTVFFALMLWVILIKIAHRLQSPNEGINQRNLKFWADVLRPYLKIWEGIWFSTVQWWQFPHWASVVCGSSHDLVICRFGLWSWGVYLQYSTAADDGHPSWGSSVIQSVIIFLWHWGNRMVFFFFTF